MPETREKAAASREWAPKKRPSPVTLTKMSRRRGEYHERKEHEVDSRIGCGRRRLWRARTRGLGKRDNVGRRLRGIGYLDHQQPDDTRRADARRVGQHRPQ